MKQYEANEKMVDLFERMAKKAENAQSDEELITFMDNAHKLFITLTNCGAFSGEISGSSGPNFSS